MEWRKIRNRIAQKSNVPNHGYIIAYTRKKVIFQKYDSLEGLDVLFGEIDDMGDMTADDQLSGELLEVHLFDEEKEYRVVATDSKRNFPDKELHAIEHLADFDIENGSEIYKEKIMLEPAFRKLSKGIKKDYIMVYNHISYDEQGMAKVDDYRLVMEG